MLKAVNTDLLTQERLELQAIEAESIGWIPLGPGVYLHHGAPADDADEAVDSVIEVVGIPGAHMAGMNIVWLT